MDHTLTAVDARQPTSLVNSGATHEFRSSEPENTSPLQKAKELLDNAEKGYIERNPKSQKLHRQAIERLPGGNTRSVLHADPFPICMERGEGNKLIDVDGHEYVFHNCFTSSVFYNQLTPFSWQVP